MDDSRLIEYYEGTHDEAERLRVGIGRLEFARTLELLGRFLAPPPARVLDVGGGTGIYASQFASKGYEVLLVDPVPSHISRALSTDGFEATLGDARSLESIDDDSFDVALLLGPLYHLQSKAERLMALH